MSMTESLIYLLSIISIIIVLSIIIIGKQSQLKKRIDGCQRQADGNDLMLEQINTMLCSQQNSFDQHKKQLEAWQLEHQQVSQQLEHRIKVLQGQLKDQLQMIEQHNAQQPEDKLYSRAQKMVLLGADVDELVVECDLPKAEAEMLVALHNKKPV
jgi:uncharacterized coiled-coil protein SlyX